MKTTRWQIAQHWAKNWNSETTKFVVDLGEPSCFACGYYEQDWDEPKTAEACWNNSGLDRAHIVADSIGGADSPENFLLLCRSCHIKAPMTNDPQIMLTWAIKRDSHWTTFWREAEREWTKYNIPLDLDLSRVKDFFVSVQNDRHYWGTHELDKISRLVALVDAYARWQKDPSQGF